MIGGPIPSVEETTLDILYDHEAIRLQDIILLMKALPWNYVTLSWLLIKHSNNM